MTDEELIQLLIQKSAAELTAAEIEWLRSRRPHSPDIERVLISRPDLEARIVDEFSQAAPDHSDSTSAGLRPFSNRTLPFHLRRNSLAIFAASLGFGIAVLQFVLRRPDRPLPKPPNSVVAEGANQSPGFDASRLIPAAAQMPDVPVSAVDDIQTVDSIESPSVITEPNPRNPVSNPVVDEPWAAALSPEAIPWAKDDPRLTVDFKSAGHDEFPESEAKRWFAPVEGRQVTWGTDLLGKPVRRIARLDGLARFRAPWPEDAVLVRDAVRYHRFDVLFLARFNGNRVSLFRITRTGDLGGLRDWPNWFIADTGPMGATDERQRPLCAVNTRND